MFKITKFDASNKMSVVQWEAKLKKASDVAKSFIQSAVIDSCVTIDEEKDGEHVRCIVELQKHSEGVVRM